MAGIIWFLFSYLTSYTLHDQTISVPDLRGYHMNELDQMTQEHGLRYFIVDSIFADDKPKGTVLEQNPEPEDLVKQDRTIYVTVNSVLPKMIPMPKLKDLSSRQASSILDILGLQVKNIETRPSLCSGCVLDQLYKGKTIDAGTPIARGEYITLIVGQGESAEKIPIPKLKGLTIETAKQRLNESSLNLGTEVYKDCATKQDSMTATIYKQSPAYSNFGTIPLGSGIDVWLRVAAVDTTVSNPTPPVNEP